MRFRIVLGVMLVWVALIPAAGAGSHSTDGAPELCFGREPTLVGSDDADLLIGGPGTDVILGRGGDDIIEGGGGRDFICAGSGADVVRGGLGGDRINGQGGADLLYGEGGKDRIKGAKGDDLIDGGRKDDVVNGGGGVDECRAAEVEKRCEPSASTIALELVADGFEQPVFVTSRPGDDRLFMADQIGTIWSLGPEPELVLDISEKVILQNERGLLAMVFHPEDPERMFINYIELGSNDNVIEEYHFPLAADTPDLPLVQEVMRLPQPRTTHNAGMLVFGPGGKLFIGVGDGGFGGPEVNAQDLGTIYGSIIRIDVDGVPPYEVPEDNPFAGEKGVVEEIFIYGLRNPWRFSFDGDALYIGDVGQFTWEEISVLDVGADAGANLGWNIVEGEVCWAEPECDPSGTVLPIHTYSHAGGRCAVTGGYVYRGDEIPALVGTYVFGDFCSGEIMGLGVVGGAVREELVVFDPAAPLLTSFGVDGDGELYVTTFGAVWKVVAGDAA